MSRSRPDRRRAARPAPSVVFAALGDETRLTLVTKLCSGEPCSIAQLAEGAKITRQAITKHLRVLQRAGLVHSVRAGRENQFALDPAPIMELRSYLDVVSRQWDHALARLKAFVEE